MSTRVDVAVAVVFNSDGQVLWGSRPEGKPYAGYWEFPGGKVEPGESVWQALVRELREELGITAHSGAPWFVIDHDYEHAKVRLHLVRVWAYSGKPKALEGQTFCWGALSSRTVAPILPATEPLLPVLSQPPIILITHFQQYGVTGQLARLEQFSRRCQSGFRVVFREKGLEPQTLFQAFTECRHWCEQHEVSMVVNSDSVLELLTSGFEVPLDSSLHLTQAHLFSKPAALERFRAVGASVHLAQHLQTAFQNQLHYAILGPVLNTATHPEATPLGWDGFSKQVALTPLPVFAVGGMTTSALKRAQDAGAHGIAMIRGIEKI
ncbi:MAG: Nudix family hydrolase [Limnobacter sp.]|nr:Nudix family hydrolase [Limnobacter sp.]